MRFMRGSSCGNLVLRIKLTKVGLSIQCNLFSCRLIRAHVEFDPNWDKWGRLTPDTLDAEHSGVNNLEAIPEVERRFCQISTKGAINRAQNV